MTVHAVANPHKHGKEPAILYDRAVGFGMVTFDKTQRTIKTECWPRFVNPLAEGSQNPGWLITINQLQNYARKPVAWLSEIWVEGAKKVIILIHNGEGVLVYALRISGNSFSPGVFAKGIYRITVSLQERNWTQSFNEVQALSLQNAQLLVKPD